MKRWLVLLASLLVFLPAASMAQISSADEKEIDTKVAAFFAKVQAGDTKGAYDAFMSPIMDEQPQVKRSMVATTEQVLAFFDGPFSYEQIDQRELGSTLIYRRYVMFNDKAPYFVTMTMFRTSKGWVCQAMYMRDVTQDDFPASN